MESAGPLSCGWTAAGLRGARIARASWALWTIVLWARAVSGALILVQSHRPGSYLETNVRVYALHTNVSWGTVMAAEVWSPRRSFRSLGKRSPNLQELSGLMATIVLPGCFQFTTFSAMRTGRTFPPRPADCEVAWLNMDPLEAALQYESIGMISFQGVHGIPTTRIDSTQNQTRGDVIADSADVEADPKLGERARVEACRFGGDAMMIGGHAMSPMPSWANSGALDQTSAVLLLHKRETPLALGATGLPGAPAGPTR